MTLKVYSGPHRDLHGLSLRAVIPLENAGLTTLEKITAALREGKLRPKKLPKWGKVRHKELIAFLHQNEIQIQTPLVHGDGFCPYCQRYLGKPTM